jgi:hypothetical protein
MTVIDFIEDMWTTQQNHSVDAPGWFPPGYPFPSDDSTPTCQLPKPPAEEDLNPSWICQNPPCPEALEQEEYEHLPSRPLTIRPSPRSESSSDSSDEEELYSSDDEVEEEDENDDEDEEDEEDEEPGPSNSRIHTYCRFPSYDDDLPLRLRNYGLKPPGHEWKQLDQEPVGWQFRRTMNGNPLAGAARFYEFRAWFKFGFALWEEQRMINLGVWSHRAISDPAPYYQRWYDLLNEDDERFNFS